MGPVRAVRLLTHGQVASAQTPETIAISASDVPRPGAEQVQRGGGRRLAVEEAVVGAERDVEAEDRDRPGGRRGDGEPVGPPVRRHPAAPGEVDRRPHRPDVHPPEQQEDRVGEAGVEVGGDDRLGGEEQPPVVGQPRRPPAVGPQGVRRDQRRQVAQLDRQRLVRVPVVGGEVEDLQRQRGRQHRDGERLAEPVAGVAAAGAAADDDQDGHAHEQHDDRAEVGGAVRRERGWLVHATMMTGTAPGRLGTWAQPPSVSTRLTECRCPRRSTWSSSVPGSPAWPPPSGCRRPASRRSSSRPPTRWAVGCAPTWSTASGSTAASSCSTRPIPRPSGCSTSTPSTCGPFDAGVSVADGRAPLRPRRPAAAARRRCRST